ncbi:peptidyl-tRNA hydrolase [Bacillus phage G]|uniref:peptidyl-tRNA hydrolase n=1 Tax=Bacillus phage G TaxID=2884420 RepID=G3MA66_9CAUD|nr:peptidyl-tRNA hydrolase [Bacillus phage G]AEO93584.1 gp325 [Bacillus phage G]
MEREIVQYHIVNSDLIKAYNVPSSKMSVQIGHGCTIIAVEYGHTNLFKEWYGERGNKQKKIVLRGKEKELNKLIELGAIPVYDNGINHVPPGSMTEVVFPPMPKEEAPKIIKRLQIYNG